MPGRTSSLQESGRATAPLSAPSNGCDSLPKLQQNLQIPQFSTDPNTSTPRYTPNYSNLNFFNKTKEKVLKDDTPKKELLTDSFLSLLHSKAEEFQFEKASTSGKQVRKEDAMSHYPDDGKRLPNYDYHQWNFRGESAGRRGPFCGTPQNHNWGAMAMANPYFASPHMMPAHAHSSGDYRMNQWSANSKLQNAHSHSKVAAVPLKSAEPTSHDPLSDLQALVATRQQIDLVDLRFPGSVANKTDEPVQLTVNKTDIVDKEITSTNNANDSIEESKSESELSSPVQATNLSKSEGESSQTKCVPTSPPHSSQETSKQVEKPDETETQSKDQNNVKEESSTSLNQTIDPCETSTTSTEENNTEIKVTVNTTLNSSITKSDEDEEGEDNKLDTKNTKNDELNRATTQASVVTDTDINSSHSIEEAVTQSNDTLDQSNSSKGDTSLLTDECKPRPSINDCLPTVSSTSTDVKIVNKETSKKKKPAKKRKRASLPIKPEPKKPKVVKVKSVVERRGPVLHIRGSREAPITVAVLNGPRNDDDDLTGQRSRTAPAAETFRRNRSRHGLFSSTLSARYDARTADPSWVCVFCKQGSHRHGLGDLFGPYVVVMEPSTDICEYSGDERDICETQKRGGRNKKSIRANNLVDHFQKMSGKLKRPKVENSQSMSGLFAVSDDEGESPRYEVWVHEVCAVWSPGVCMVDTRLLGLQEAVWHCKNEICSKCGVNGANVGCIHRNCPNRSHYPCAEDAGWSLPHDTFISTCHFHLQRT